MKCPLMKWETENSHLTGFNNCIKAECAWWIDASNQCVIKALARQSLNKLPDIVKTAVAVYGDSKEQ